MWQFSKKALLTPKKKQTGRATVHLAHPVVADPFTFAESSAFSGKYCPSSYPSNTEEELPDIQSTPVHLYCECMASLSFILPFGKE